MNKLVTINAIQHRMSQGVPIGRVDETAIRRLWWAAVDILQEEILLKINISRGLWLASPLPALYEPKLLNRLQGWVWTPDELATFRYQNAGLLPPDHSNLIDKKDLPTNYNRLKLYIF